MTAPAMRGPTESMKTTEATSTSHTKSGRSHIRIPGARMLIAVVMKFTPPTRKATNSSATAKIQRLTPQFTPLNSTPAESGG